MTQSVSISNPVQSSQRERESQPQTPAERTAFELLLSVQLTSAVPEVLGGP